MTFSEWVANVGSEAFVLQPSLSGSGIVGVTSDGTSNALWFVTVDTGSGEGELGVEVLASATIVDRPGNPLQEGYSGGETYTTIRQLFADGFESGDLTAWSSR